MKPAYRDQTGRRSRLRAAAVLLLALALLLTFACRTDQDRIVLIAADDHPLDYPTTQGLVSMKEFLERETDGRITLDIFPDKRLGDEKSTIEQTQLGIIDLNRVNVNPLTQLSPLLGALSLPYIFLDVDHMHAVLDGPIGEELLMSLKERGLIGLCYYDSGARSFYNTVRPLHSPRDLVGLKIRVQKSEIMIDMVRALGGSPTPMSFGEVYTSLASGVIEGAENNWPSYDYTGHYQVARYYSLDEHSMAPEMVVMSLRAWERLSPEDRALIKKAALKSVEVQRRLWRELEKKSEEKVRAAGNQINAIPDKTEFIEAVAPVYEKQYRTNPMMKDLVERIRAVAVDAE